MCIFYKHVSTLQTNCPLLVFYCLRLIQKYNQSSAAVKFKQFATNVTKKYLVNKYFLLITYLPNPKLTNITS